MFSEKAGNDWDDDVREDAPLLLNKETKVWIRYWKFKNGWCPI
jgi:hypothetical protein